MRIAQRPRGPEVWLLIGQSNMRGPSVDPTNGPTLPRADIRFWYTSEQHQAVADAALSINPYVTVQGRGLELSLATTLADSKPKRRIAICKVCRTGTGLYANWAPWSRNATGVTNTLMGNAIAELRAFMAELVADDPDCVPYVGGCVISQWESDATDALAAGYGGRLRWWIERIRAETNPYLDVYWLAPSTGQTGGPVIAAARNSIASQGAALALTDPHFHVVTTQGAALDVDALHFTPNALQTFGVTIGNHALGRARQRLRHAAQKVYRSTIYTSEAAAITAAAGQPVYRNPVDDFWAVANQKGKSYVNRETWRDESTLPGIPALRFFPFEWESTGLDYAIQMPYLATEADFRSGRIWWPVRPSENPKTLVGLRALINSGLTVASVFFDSSGGNARMNIFTEGASLSLTSAVPAASDWQVIDRDFTPGHGANNIKWWCFSAGVWTLIAQGTIADGNDWTDGQVDASIFALMHHDLIAARSYLGTVGQPYVGAFVP